MQRHVIVALRVLCLVLLLVMAASAQQSPTLPALTQAANSDPAYRSLRSPGLGEVVPLRELVLQRDAGTFTLTGALTSWRGSTAGSPARSSSAKGASTWRRPSKSNAAPWRRSRNYPRCTRSSIMPFSGSPMALSRK